MADRNKPKRVKSVMQDIYDSWEWKLREKLTDANDVVRRIYFEAAQFDIKADVYEAFMREKLDAMLQEIGDRAGERLQNGSEA